MKGLRNTLVFLLLLILTAVAVVGAMATLPWTPGPLARVRETGMEIVRVWQPGGMLFWMFVGVLFGILLVAAVTISQLRRSARVEVHMADGRVVILESAIKKYIRTALAELQGISVKRIDLAQQRTGLRVDVTASVRTTEKLPDAQARIMARVHEALIHKMGISAISGVHVYIQDFQMIAPSVQPDERDIPLDEDMDVPSPVFPLGPLPVTLHSAEPDVVAMSGTPSTSAPDSGLLTPPEAQPDRSDDEGDAQRGEKFFSRFMRSKAEEERLADHDAAFDADAATDTNHVVDRDHDAPESESASSSVGPVDASDCGIVLPDDLAAQAPDEPQDDQNKKA